MFPSHLPHPTHSTTETAPKLDDFYNSVDSSALPDMVAKYFPSSQKTEEYRLTPYGNASSLKLNSLKAVKLKNAVGGWKLVSYFVDGA